MSISRRLLIVFSGALAITRASAAVSGLKVKGKAMKATYVLVHGGGHGGWCWQRVASRLRARGHEVYTPTMTGLGERAHLLNPNIDLNLHIKRPHIREPH
jgi:alpha-beta hydrolase superfamily lysophospholipase